MSLQREKSESPESEERLLPCFSPGDSIRDASSGGSYCREDEDSVWRGMLAGLLRVWEKEGILTDVWAEMEQPLLQKSRKGMPNRGVQQKVVRAGPVIGCALG